MKLYIENNEVLFDFSDVDTKAELNSKTDSYRNFLRSTVCRWEFTHKWQVKRMVFDPYDGMSEYERLKYFERLLSSCYYRAKGNEFIELDESIERVLKETANRCKELYEAEQAKEEERKREAEWEYLQKHGCKQCKHKRRWNDDYKCAASGDILPERDAPNPFGKSYELFNYVPFPTDNCPFNINKNKEKNNECISETCASETRTQSRRA